MSLKKLSDKNNELKLVRDSYIPRFFCIAALYIMLNSLIELSKPINNKNHNTLLILSIFQILNVIINMFNILHIVYIIFKDFKLEDNYYNLLFKYHNKALALDINISNLYCERNLDAITIDKERIKTDEEKTLLEQELQKDQLTILNERETRLETGVSGILTRTWDRVFNKTTINDNPDSTIRLDSCPTITMK